MSMAPFHIMNKVTILSIVHKLCTYVRISILDFTLPLTHIKPYMYHAICSIVLKVEVRRDAQLLNTVLKRTLLVCSLRKILQCRTVKTPSRTNSPPPEPSAGAQESEIEPSETWWLVPAQQSVSDTTRETSVWQDIPFMQEGYDQQREITTNSRAGHLNHKVGSGT